MTGLYFAVVPDGQDDCPVPVSPFAVPLEGVSEFLKTWFGMVQRQGYFSNVRQERIPPDELGITLVPIQPDEDDEERAKQFAERKEDNPAVPSVIEWLESYIDDCTDPHSESAEQARELIAALSERRAVEEPMPNDCPECARSNGANYTGDCEHGEERTDEHGGSYAEGRSDGQGESYAERNA